jgi:hypothetical protein
MAPPKRTPELEKAFTAVNSGPGIPSTKSVENGDVEMA